MQGKTALVCALVLSGSLMVAGGVSAQSLEERLAQFGQDVAEGYIHPVVDAFGANLNSGINHQAKTHGFLGFDVGFRLMTVPVPDDAKTFVAPAPPVIPGGDWGVPEVETATAVGTEDGGAVLNGTGLLNGQTFEYPGGMELDWVPLVVPQANVGLIMGTDLMVRYLPSVSTTDEIGDVNFLGIGVRHKVSQYIPAFPLDVSVYGMYQSLEIGTYLESSASSFGVVASKSVPLLTFYGGLAKESSSMTIKYTIDGDSPYNPTPTIPFAVEFDMDGEVSSRATVGFRLSVLPLTFLSAEASKAFGSDNVGSVFGIGFGLNLSSTRGGAEETGGGCTPSIET